MNLGISQKKAIITGADHGLARAIAVDLAKEGVAVALISAHQAKAKAILREIGGTQKGHAFFSGDLTKENTIQAIAQKIDEDFGDVDILINCMDSYQYNGPAHISLAAWRHVLHYNLESVIEVNNFYIPRMKKKGWGRIVNISAGASMEHAATLAYCTSKAALTAYTRCMGRILAIESANVVMSAVLPGALLAEDGYWASVQKKNPQEARSFLASNAPLGRFGKPEEVSPMVVMLVSEQATYCQGAIVPIDGGQARHYFQLERTS